MYDWVLNTPLLIAVTLDEEKSQHEGNANEERIHFPDGVKPAVVKVVGTESVGNNHSDLRLPYYDDHRESSDSDDHSFDPFRSFLGDDVFNFDKEEEESVETVTLLTTQKMKFSIKDLITSTEELLNGKNSFFVAWLIHFMTLLLFLFLRISNIFSRYTRYKKRPAAWNGLIL